MEEDLAVAPGPRQRALRLAQDARAESLAEGAYAGDRRPPLLFVAHDAALPHLAPARAAIVQLAVPVIAAAGGAAILGESVTFRLAGATAAILGGIALVLAVRRR